MKSLLDAFGSLVMQPKLRHIHTIVWDLDGTLGPVPGWSGGNVPLLHYVGFPSALRDVLNYLDLVYGIRHVISSRNGMVCGDNLAVSTPQFDQLGFHQVDVCPRNRMNTSKVADRHTWERAGTLLIDDRLSECQAATRDGAYALWIPNGNVAAPALEAILTQNYQLLLP